MRQEWEHKKHAEVRNVFVKFDEDGSSKVSSYFRYSRCQGSFLNA